MRCAPFSAPDCRLFKESSNPRNAATWARYNRRLGAPYFASSAPEIFPRRAFDGGNCGDGNHAADAQRVVRLALIDTNPMADATDRAAIRQKQIKQVQAGKLRSVMRDEMKPNYLAKGSERARILKLCMDMAEALGPAVFTEQSIALQYRRDQCETLKAINVPTDIICGEDDRLCPVSRHEFMHDLIAGSTLSIIPGAGHLPTLEQPKIQTGYWKNG